MGDLVPTARLRWVNRVIQAPGYLSVQVLQQWWAADVPSYMRDPLGGEWRDVQLEEEK